MYSNYEKLKTIKKERKMSTPITYRDTPITKKKLVRQFAAQVRKNPSFALTGKNVKKREGWNVAMIKTYLGEPDAILPHPENKGEEIKWYASERVKKVEQFKSFQAQIPADKRLVNVIDDTNVSQEEINHMLHIVQQFALHDDYIGLEKDELYQKAVKHNNKKLCEKNVRDRFHNIDTYQTHELNNLAVNFLRHVGSPYDNLVDSLDETNTRFECIDALRIAMFEAIYEHYPFLYEACKQQAKERGLSI